VPSKSERSESVYVSGDICIICACMMGDSLSVENEGIVECVSFLDVFDFLLVSGAAG
jgi:hypothetical protein